MSAAIRHVWMPQKAAPAAHAAPLPVVCNFGGCGCGPCAAEEESTGSDPVSDCGDALGSVSCLCAGTITHARMHMYRPMHKQAFIRRACFHPKGMLGTQDEQLGMMKKMTGGGRTAEAMPCLGRYDPPHFACRVCLPSGMLCDPG